MTNLNKRKTRDREGRLVSRASKTGTIRRAQLEREGLTSSGLYFSTRMKLISANRSRRSRVIKAPVKGGGIGTMTTKDSESPLASVLEYFM